MIAVNKKAVQAEELMISFIKGTDYAKLDQQVMESSKNSIFDCIGVALAEVQVNRRVKYLSRNWKRAGGCLRRGFRRRIPYYG